MKFYKRVFIAVFAMALLAACGDVTTPTKPEDPEPVITVLQINQLQPYKGEPGTLVTIKGEGINSGLERVAIGDVEVIPESSKAVSISSPTESKVTSENQLTFIVPDLSQRRYDVRVLREDAESNVLSFVVLPKKIVIDDPTDPKCEEGQIIVDGVCVSPNPGDPNAITCPENRHIENGVCVCDDGLFEVGGKCVEEDPATQCGEGTQWNESTEQCEVIPSGGNEPTEPTEPTEPAQANVEIETGHTTFGGGFDFIKYKFYNVREAFTFLITSDIDAFEHGMVKPVSGSYTGAKAAQIESSDILSLSAFEDFAADLLSEAPDDASYDGDLQSMHYCVLGNEEAKELSTSSYKKFTIQLQMDLSAYLNILEQAAVELGIDASAGLSDADKENITQQMIKNSEAIKNAITSTITFTTSVLELENVFKLDIVDPTAANIQLTVSAHYFTVTDKFSADQLCSDVEQDINGKNGIAIFLPATDEDDSQVGIFPVKVEDVANPMVRIFYRTWDSNEVKLAEREFVK